jgi:hypothetical protein
MQHGKAASHFAHVSPIIEHLHRLASFKTVSLKS